MIFFPLIPFRVFANFANNQEERQGKLFGDTQKVFFGAPFLAQERAVNPQLVQLDLRI